ncbi:cation:dicarboxylate symporter family transporter [Sphingomonas kyeonggiensis]|uniref:Na+/H+-dicarboxylate symporter n=1 Tax=Sphingomonas kyeonggiensis TaxID=1268553 RepID=A0A7W6JVV8_9SPHN|nr:cation:dicarboxylase symporter family transporter [Sphingomonas kyeonggiensis]MBB4099365.1 Na+/H+-dicarboxylate symporter [Sphingomonas kyeonggiensis]
MLIGILAGSAIGWWWPAAGQGLGPLGIAFVKAMRMMVPPVLFCTIVEGIVRHGAARDTGATLLRSVALFLAITVVALGVGMGVTMAMQPGRGLAVPSDASGAADIAHQLAGRHLTGPGDFLVHIVPDTLFSAFTAGDALPVLFVAGLVGFGLLRIGEAGAPIVRAIEALTKLQFAIFGFLIRAAPVGAFGAIAYTVGTFGIGFLGSLGLLTATLALACGLLVSLLVAAVWLSTGIGGLLLLRLFREELLIVLGTSSSEVVLPRLIQKLEALGCPRGIVGLTVPLGYSLNLAGTAVYLIVATLFLAEALEVPLSPGQVALYLAVMLVTSKAAAGVTGSGFSALLLTLSLLPEVPVGAAAMLIAIDRFLSEIRALTSTTANVTASLLVARWSGARPGLPPGFAEQR